MNNDKLIGSLRLNLEMLKKDASSANDIIKNLNNLKIDKIDVSNGKDIIKTLRLIEAELDKIKKETGQDINTDVTKKLENSIKNLGVDVESTVTKITDTVKRNNDQNVTSIKKTIDTIDELGKKVQESKTTRNYYDKNGNLSSQKNDYSKTTTLTPKDENEDESLAKNLNAYKEALAEVQNEHNQLIIDNKLDANSLQGLSDKLNVLRNSYKLTENELKPLLTTQKQYKTEMDSLIDTEKKQSGQSTNSYLTSYKSKLNEIDKEYLQLNSTGEKRITDLNKLSEKTKTLSSELGLEGTAWKEAEKKAQSFDNEANRITTSLNKVTAAEEKQSLSELKLFTQEKAQSSQYDNMTKNLSNVSGEKKLAMSSSDSESSIGDRFKVSAIYSAAAASIYTVVSAVKNAITTNENYETSLKDLGRVLGNVTDTQLKQFGQQAIGVSKQFGISLEDVQSAMNELAQSGVTSKTDLNSMTKSVMTGINTSEIKDANQMAQYLISSLKQLNMPMSDSNKMLDSWNKMADVSVSKVSDFAEATSKAGAASAAMGIDMNHLNAIVSVLGNKTGATGDEIGEAIKAMEAKLTTPKALKVLQQYGIEVMKDKTHFKDFDDIMKQVDTTITKFGDNSTQTNDILSALGGTLRRNWIDILGKNYDQIDAAVKQSIDSAGYSAQKNAAIMDTLAKKVGTFKSTIKELYIGLGNSGLSGQLKGLVDIGTWLAGAGAGLSGFLLKLGEVTLALKAFSSASKIITNQNLTQLLDKMPKIKIGNLQFGGTTTSTKAYDAAVNSLAQDIEKGNIKGKESATILEVVRDKIGLAKSSTNTYAAAERALKDTTFANSKEGKELAKEMNDLKKSHKEADTAAKGQAASEKALDASQKATATSARTLKLEEMALDLVITIVFAGISKLITYFSEADERQQEMLQNGADAAKQYQDEINSTQDLINQYTELSASGKTDKDTKNQLLDIQKQLIDSYGDEAKGLDLVNGKYDDQITKIQKLNKEKAKKYINENLGAYYGAKNTLGEGSTQVHVTGRIIDIANKTDPEHAGTNLSNTLIVNGKLQDRIKILNEILKKADSLSNKSASEVKTITKLSDESKNMSKNMTDSENIIEKINIAALRTNDKYSANMGKITAAVEAYKKAINSGDTSGAKKAADDFTRLNEVMIKSIGNNKGLQDAFNDFIDSLNMTGDAAKDTSGGISSLSDVETGLADSMSKAATNIEAINKVLEEHAKSGEWDKKEIIALAKTYPQLIDVMNDDKALEKELIKLKGDEVAAVKNGLAKEIEEQRQYVNGLVDVYNFDIKNYTDAENAKSDILDKALSKRLKLYKEDADAALVAINVAKTPEDKDSASRGGLRAGDLWMMEYAKEESAIDAYFQLKHLSTNVTPTLLDAGLSSVDGKKNKTPKTKSSSEAYSATIDIDNYKTAMSMLTDEIDRQEKSIANLSNVAKRYNDSKDYINAIKEENTLLSEQEKHLTYLNQQSLKSAQHIQSQLISGLAHYGIKTVGLTNSQIEAEYNKKYGGTHNFGRGDAAKKKKDVFDKESALVKQWIEDYKTAVDTVSNIKDKITSITTDIISTTTDLVKSRIDLMDKSLNNINTKVTNAKNDLDLFNDDDKNNMNYQEKIELTNNIIKNIENHKKQLIEINSILSAELPLYKNMGVVWDQINDKITENKNLIVEDAKSLLEYNKDLESTNEDYLNATKTVEDKIVALLKQKYKEIEDAEENRHKKVTDDYEKEKKAFDDIIDEKLKKLQEEQDKNDYSEQLNKLLTEKSKLQLQHDELLMDNSQESVAKRADLEQQLSDKQKEINDYQTKHNYNLRKQGLDNQKEANDKFYDSQNKKEEEAYEEHKKAIDKNLENDKIYAEAQKAIMDGVYTDSTGKIQDLQTGLLDFEDKFGDGLSALGGKIKTELIDNLTKVTSLLKSGFYDKVNKEVKSSTNSSGSINDSTSGNSILRSLTVFAHGIDLINAKAIFGTNSGIDFEDTKATSKQIKQGDIVVGGSAVTGKFNDALLSNVGALRIYGKDRNETAQKLKNFVNSLKGYSEGGVIDYTGLAQVHGTSANPEMILNSKDTKKVYDMIHSFQQISIPNIKDIQQQLLKVDIPEMYLPKIEISNLQQNGNENIPNKNVDVHFDNLINVEGNVDKDVLPDLKNISSQVIAEIQKAFNKYGVFKK